MASMSKATTTTPRSVKWLRDRGYCVANVEQWLTFPERKFGKPTGKTIRIRKDCFGFCDLAACHPDENGTLYIQTTTRANQSARRNKILLSPDAATLLRAKNRIHVHGWAQMGGSGKRKLWEVSIWEARLEHGKVNFYPLFDEENF